MIKQAEREEKGGGRFGGEIPVALNTNNNVTRLGKLRIRKESFFL